MTRLKRRLIGVGLLASVMMIGSGYAASADTIKIGVFGPLTGDAAATGASERQAVDLAINEKNVAGGIRGKQIEAIYADDAGKPEEAVNVAKRLTERDNVVIMIGSISSPASLAASQVAALSGTAQIVVSGTAQKITTQGNKWVFRSPVPDTKLAGDLATFINEKFPKVKKIAFLYVNDDFGRGGFRKIQGRRRKIWHSNRRRGTLHAWRSRLHRPAWAHQGQSGTGLGRMVALCRGSAGRQAIRADEHDNAAIWL